MEKEWLKKSFLSYICKLKQLVILFLFLQFAIKYLVDLMIKLKNTLKESFCYLIMLLKQSFTIFWKNKNYDFFVEDIKYT